MERNYGIILEGVANTRDLGGITMPDGKKIRKGLLLRGGDLAKASDGAIRTLNESYGVCKVFDFRTKGEVSHKPDREVPGAANLWLPTIDENTGEVTETLGSVDFRHLEDWLVKNAMRPEVQKFATTMYTSAVVNEYTQLQYAAFLQQVVSAGGAVYWHCSQGKDRTGLGAAFILTALGADRKTIVEEFALSNVFYSDAIRVMKEAVLAIGGDDAALEVIQTFIGVNVKYFEDALDLIEANWVSLPHYVEEVLMLSKEDAAALKDRCLE